MTISSSDSGNKNGRFHSYHSIWKFKSGERFGQVAPEEVVEIRPPRSNVVLFLKVKELPDLVWE